jgi:hypothetical protein
MEVVEKLVAIKVDTDADKALKLVAEPNYHRTVIYSENLTVVQKNSTRVKYNKPIYFRMWIFEISKTLIFKRSIVTVLHY